MKRTFYLTCFLIPITLISCVKTQDFDPIGQECVAMEPATKSIKNIYEVANNQVSRYIDEVVIEGYVVSNDQAGNFFKQISIQALDGSIGCSLKLDQTDLYTQYNPGRKIYVKLKNSYVRIKNETLEIGALYIDNFNNETIGRIAYPDYELKVLNSCEVADENSLFNLVTIDNLSDSQINTLIELNEVQFANEALSSTFYDQTLDDSFATNHSLEDRYGYNIALRTSAFADFAGVSIPNNSGSIKGVLTKFNGNYQLIIRSLDDIQFKEDRFKIELKNNLFFTELADPDNNNKARFIELYNNEETAVNLNSWSIRRYTNDNLEVSSVLDLTGYVIASGQAFVIAANADEFELVFGFRPDLEGGFGGAADSNGDDNLELVDSQGNIVDVFGLIGQDGSGTNHEFEDGRALRVPSVIIGNQTYTFSEWIIYNDSGLAGTMNSPQIAPENFSPGVR